MCLVLGSRCLRRRGLFIPSNNAMVGHPFFPSRADGKEKGGTLRAKWWAIATAATLVLLLAGAVQAAGWVDSFNGGAQQTWAVVDGGTNSTYVVQNNRYELHTESSDGTAKSLASYVNTGAADCIIQARVQRISPADNFLTYLLARGTIATMSGYVCGTSSAGTHLWFGKLTNGIYANFAPVASAAVSYNPSDFQVRFSVIGNTLAAKVWTTGTVEPSNWQLTATDTSYVSGVGGVVLATYPTYAWNVVQAALDEVSLTELSKSTVWVDASWVGTATNTEVAPGKIYGYNAFATIQAGINAVAAGGTVNVAAGLYLEEVSIVGKNDITLAGAGEGLTVIAPYRAYTTNNYGIFINNANGLHIQDLNVDGFANPGLSAGVAHYKDGIHWDALGGNNNTITRVTIKNIDRRGVSVWPENVYGNEISYCTIDNVTGVNNGEGYAHAIKFNGSGAVEHNTISNVTGAILGNCDVVGGTLSIQDNIITALTGLTATPFDIGINFWCKRSNVITVKNNSITASVDDNTGIYVVRGGDGSEISYNTLNLTGNGGLGIETGWENTWGFPIHHNTITMGRGGAGIVITGAGSDADPMLVYDNTLTNVGSDASFVNQYTGYSLREVGLLLSGHQYTSRTGDANYSFNGSVYGNSINGFKDGIVFASQVYAAGGFKDVEVILSEKNSITNYETAARYGYISNTSPYPFITIGSGDTNYSAINATNNWWGTAVGSEVASHVEGNVTYDPWYVDAAMTILSNSTGASAKAITAFSFNGLSPAVTGTVTEGTHSVALTVPFGTNVTALVPTITHTGVSVSPASGVARDFTTPQTYTVTAVNGSTQAYAVTVTLGVAGAVTYVDAARPNDSGDGLSPATAKKTIQSGINIVAADGTVHVAAGTYSEHITITKSLTLQGSSDPSPIIDGGGAGTAVTISASGVTVTGFTIQNASTGIAATSGTGNAVHLCNILNNSAWGVNNTSGNRLDATDNSWGIDSGPSGGAADPVTGRLADGTGGRVSANVRFDPWTGMSTSVVTEPDVGQGGVVTNPDAGASLTIDTASGTTDVTIAEYTSPPPDTPSFGAGATYLDIMLSDPGAVTQLTITFDGMSAGTVIYFYRPGTGWVRCSIQTQAGSTITVTVTASTTPTLAELTGTIFAGGTGVPVVEYAMGDVSGNGVIDVLDARLCLQIATGFLAGTPEQRAAADVDDDGDVDLADAEILAEYIIGIITELPGAE